MSVDRATPPTQRTLGAVKAAETDSVDRPADDRPLTSSTQLAETVRDMMQPRRGPWWQWPFGFVIRRRNKAIVRRMMQAFNSGDADILDQLEDPNYVDVMPFPPGYRGVEGIKRQIRDLHEAFADLRFEETACIAEGDIVVLRHRMTGIHRASFLGVPPTNKWISYPGQEINRVRNGKIVEHIGSLDILEFLDALGVLDGELLEHPKLKRLRAHVARQLISPSGSQAVTEVISPTDSAPEASREQARRTG